MYAILLIGVILSLAFYLVGSVFIEGRLTRGIGFLQNVINLWVGILLAVSVYAIIKTAMITILVLLLLVIVFFRKKFTLEKAQNPFGKLRFGLVLAGTYVLVFFIQVNFQLDVFAHPLDYLKHLHGDDGERYIYSHIVSLLYYEGVETISVEAVLKGFTGVSLYHFAEFWLASLFKTVHNANSDLVLFYFVFPLLKTLCVLTIYSIYADKLDTYKRKLLGVFIVFGFLVLGLRWIFPPHAVADLRAIVLLPFLILIAKLLYDKQYDAACGFLLIAGIENVLFLPAAGLYLLLFFDKIEKRTLYLFGAYVVAYPLFFLLFKERVMDKYMTLSLLETFQTIIGDAPAKRIFRIFLIAFLSYQFKVLLSFLLLNNYPALTKRLWVRDVGYWLLLCFVVYHVLFGVFQNLSVDAYQFTSVGVGLAAVSFFFVLARLIDQGKYIVSLVIMLLVTDYTYPFGQIKTSRAYEGVLEEKLKKIGEGKVLKGLFVDENSSLKDQFFLFFYPTHVTEYARANDYRTYLFIYDVTGQRKSLDKIEPGPRKIVSRIVQPLFPVDRPILENIQKYGISVVWISKTSKYLTSFQGKKPLYVLPDFLVYYLEPAN
ncbi:hypothetical protein TH63_02690 [Rufibacter radiotolerans]|uniref:Uncharacterized protein n=1 Tax=Rufibacter radiotolerans TaxID=1379910 RepID=A0A0H4W2V6_9BACT|nr:hypothetical protein [Rufibacter radiotolerans]AKQ44776.1 hypothetical protein TH63_02690 [Rufibacter radiotolerans]